MADISALFASNESRLMKIEDPATGEVFKTADGKEMGILLTDANTDACNRVKSDFDKKVAEASRKNRDVSYESKQVFTADLLAAATVGFENIVMDGKPLEFSAKNARKLYKKSPVIRDMVNKFVGADELFMKGAQVAGEE